MDCVTKRILSFSLYLNTLIVLNSIIIIVYNNLLESYYTCMLYRQCAYMAINP